VKVKAHSEDCLKGCYKDKSYTIKSTDELESRFNAHLLPKTLLQTNDASRRNIDSLKADVTDDTFHYEIKNGGVVTNVKNHFNFLVFGNETLEFLVPQKMNADKRRWLILEASRKHIDNYDYFKKLNDYINDDEVIQMTGYYFKTLNLKDWNRFKIPETEEQKKAKVEQNTFYEFLLEEDLSDDNFIEHNGKKWIKKETLYDFYEVWFGNNYDVHKDASKLKGKKAIDIPVSRFEINGVRDKYINKKDINSLIEKLKN